jgi:hypothetical protein
VDAGPFGGPLGGAQRVALSTSSCYGRLPFATFRGKRDRESQRPGEVESRRMACQLVRGICVGRVVVFR